MNDITRQDGLTDEEGEVMDALIYAWNQFSQLEIQHPSDAPDFADGIHKCQQSIALRVVRREYPDGWYVNK